MGRTAIKLQQILGREPTDEELAEERHLRQWPERVINAFNQNRIAIQSVS